MRGLRYICTGSAWSLQESKCHTADLRHSAVPALCTMSGSCGSMHLATGCNLDVLRKPALSAGRNSLLSGAQYLQQRPQEGCATPQVLHCECCRCSFILIGFSGLTCPMPCLGASSKVLHASCRCADSLHLWSLCRGSHLCITLMQANGGADKGADSQRAWPASQTQT